MLLLNKPLQVQLVYEVLVMSNGCTHDLCAAVLLGCSEKQGCCSGNREAIFAAFQGGLCRKLPAGRDLVFELPEGSYMLTRCLVGAGVVGVESQGQRGQQAKWEVGTCAVPCREGCGRGPDGVKGWQGQEGQR